MSVNQTRVIVINKTMPELITTTQLGPAQKWEKGLVTLAKIPICAVSALFVWSRGITFVHCQLTAFLTREGSRLVP